jgi:hypothetical protein
LRFSDFFDYLSDFPQLLSKIGTKIQYLLENFPKCGPETDLGWPPDLKLIFDLFLATVGQNV